MRKTIFVITILSLVLCAFLPASAKQYMSSLSKDVRIYGFIDKYCLVFVTPLEAQDTSSLSGMPFDITGTDIKYKPDDTEHVLGREIASWSFATNVSEITLRFNATPLANEEDNTATLDYYLTFRYQYNGENTVHTGYIPVLSGVEKSVTLTNVSSGDSIPIISMGMDVRFQLSKDYPNIEDTSVYPTGFYYADVVITMEGL